MAPPPEIEVATLSPSRDGGPERRGRTELGYLLHRPAAVSAQPTTSTAVADTAPVTQLVVPAACLETARRSDETVTLLLANPVR